MSEINQLYKLIRASSDSSDSKIMTARNRAHFEWSICLRTPIKGHVYERSQVMSDSSNNRRIDIEECKYLKKMLYLKSEFKNALKLLTQACHL